MNIAAALRKTAPARSSERVALAEKIERCNALLREKADNEKAQAAVREAIRAARRTVGESAALIERAKADAVAHLMATAGGTASGSPPSVKAARAAAQDAEDAHAAANEALIGLEMAHKAITDNLGWISLDERAKDVIRSEVDIEPLLRAYTAAHREYVSRRRELEFLAGLGAIPQSTSLWRNEEAWPELPGDRPWVEAIEALKADPDSPLPAVISGEGSIA